MITSHHMHMIKMAIQMYFQVPDTSYICLEVKSGHCEENNVFWDVAVAGGDLQYGSRWTLNVWWWSSNSSSDFLGQIWGNLSMFSAQHAYFTSPLFLSCLDWQAVRFHSIPLCTWLWLQVEFWMVAGCAAELMLINFYTSEPVFLQGHPMVAKGIIMMAGMESVISVSASWEFSANSLEPYSTFKYA